MTAASTCSTELQIAEASAFDLLETVDDQGAPLRLRRTHFGKLARQVSQGATVSIRDARGQLVIVAGLWPENDHAEAWFAAGPAAARRLVPALRLLRRLMDFACREARVREVRTYTAPDGVAGARIAAVLGFEAQGLIDGGATRLFARRFS